MKAAPQVLPYYDCESFAQPDESENSRAALLGGAAGLLFAHFGEGALLAAGPVNLPRPHPNAIPGALRQFSEVGINGWVIAFTFGLSLLTGVISGLAPALKLSRPDLNSFLKEGAAVSVPGFRLFQGRQLQSLLVVAEFALALVLLIGADLLVRNFWRLQEITPGFQPKNCSRTRPVHSIWRRSRRNVSRGDRARR